MNSQAQAFYTRLEAADWFSEVGRPYQAATNKRLVHTWEEAAEWCASPISWWSNVEGKKLLYEELAKSHYQQFTTWNATAQSLLPSVTNLLTNNILHKIPPEFVTGKVKEWIQSQLLSAFLELQYAEYVKVTLFSDQIEHYLNGHFPCGWLVDTPADFPDRSVLVIY